MHKGGDVPLIVLNDQAALLGHRSQVGRFHSGRGTAILRQAGEIDCVT